MGQTRLESRRAYRIRKKMADGQEVSDADRSFLETWKPKRPGRPKLEVVRDESAPADAPGEVADPGIAPEFQVSAEGVEAPAPETPKVTPRADKARAHKGDWRAKYRLGGADSDREQTCVQLAAFWLDGLAYMNDTIVANGGSPMIPTEMLIGRTVKGEIVLGALGRGFVIAVDQLVPTDFAIGPEIQAACVSTGVIGQAWWTKRKATKRETAADKAKRVWVNPAPTPSTDTEATDDKPEPPKVVKMKPPIDDSTVF